MPIRFRCSYCNRLLGIATRKAGTETTCPHCGYTITVPVPTEDDAKTEHINMDDVDALLGNGATERFLEPATQVVQPPAPVAAESPARPAEAPRVEPPKPTPAKAPPPPVPKPSPAALSLSGEVAPAPKPRPAPPPVPKVAPKPAAKATSDEPPLFEGDVDALLGHTAAPAEDERAKPPPTSGQDAMSLGEPPRMLVISSQKATLLMGAVVVLLAAAFAAGYAVALAR